MSYITIPTTVAMIGVITSITGNVGGAITPDAVQNIAIIGTDPITVTGVLATHTLTITVADAGEAQKGVLETSTNVESIAGTVSTVAVVPTSLKAKLGLQTAHAILLGEGTTSALGTVGPLTNGQLAIGSTGADPVAATLTEGENVTITNGAGSISIAAYPKIYPYNGPITHAMLVYAVNTNDVYIAVDTGGGVVTIQLPNATVTGRSYIVKDRGGVCSVSNITVTTVGGVVLIDGSASYVMNTNYQSANFIFNSSTWEVF